MVALLGGSLQFVMNVSATGANLLLDLIRDRQVTIVWGVPAVLRLLFEADAAAPALASLRAVRTFGDRLLSAECAAWRAALPETCHLAITYGQTESTTAQWYVPRDFTADVATLPTGYLLPEHEYAILDDDGTAAAEGEVGELVLRSRYVALGEWEHGAVVAGRLRPDPVDPKRRILPTGDLVRLRRDGLLQIISRVDRQLKINGLRVEPAEVEDALRRVQGTTAAVTVVRREGGDDVLLAFIVAADPTDLSLPKRARAAVNKSLPTYMQPARILVIDRFPLLPGGKVDEKALLAIADATPRELQQALHTPAVTLREAPLSSIESRVLGIMRDVLSHGDLGPDADFFDAGGDSLLAITLMLRFDSEFGRKLPARVLNGAFSARRLAAILESPFVLGATYPAGVVEIRAGTAHRPLFCLPGLKGTAFTFRTLAAKLHTRRPVLAIELHNLEVGPSVLESIKGTAAALIGRMREVQPVGPYSILGYSFGGNLAVEVTRQLIANDQTVELVAILDAHAPGSLRNPVGLSKLTTHLRIIRRQKLHQTYIYILSRIHRRLFRRSQNSLAKAPPLPKIEIERRLAEVANHCIRALDAHYPEIFSGRIVLLRATDLDDWIEVADPAGTCGWGSICKGGVHVIPIACRHLDLIKEPHITELAGHIDDLLNVIDS
jgi:thioesterase domain-containing protein/acyl carrier protein